jgi:hypothetical protein
MTGQIAYLARETQRQEQLESAARMRLAAQAPRPARRLRARRLRLALVALIATAARGPVALPHAGTAGSLSFTTTGKQPSPSRRA